MVSLARRRPAALAAVGYLLLVLVLLAPSIRPGRTLVPADALSHYEPYRSAAGGLRADNPIVSDAATQFLPWWRFLAEHLRDGRSPHWNPLVLGGVPVQPNGYVTADYPPFHLARAMSTFDAFDVFVVLHLWLAAFGVYVLSRVLGARSPPSFVAGLAAPAAGFWLHWSLHPTHLAAVAWLPWALAAAHVTARRGRARDALALAAVLALWWRGANPQYAYFGALAVLGWSVAVVVVRRSVRNAVALGVAAVVGGLVAAPAVLPVLDPPMPILRTSEPAVAMTRTALPLRHAVRVVVADAVGNPADGFLYASDAEQAMDSPYVGAAIAVLGVAAVAAGRRRRAAVALALAAVAALVLAFVGPIHVPLHSLVPAYDRFRGSARWVAVLPVFALPLGALGLDALLAGDRRARRGAVAAAAVVATGVVAWLLREALVDDAPHGYLVRRGGLAACAAGAVAAIGATAARRRVPARVLCVAAAAVVVVEVAFVAPRWFPSVVQRGAYPDVAAVAAARDAGGRLLRVGDPAAFPRAVPPDVPMASGAADTSGLTPFLPADYARLLRGFEPAHRGLARRLNVVPPLRTGDTPRVRAALDVRTVVDERGTIVGRAAAHPALLVRRARPGSVADLFAAAADPAWEPAATAVVAGLGRDVTGPGGAVREVPTGEPDRQRFVVDSARGGFLRVSGRWDPGWRARVAGGPAAVLRADGAFRGVVVPGGRDVPVELTYRNPRTDAARALARAGAVGLALLAVAAGRAARREHDAT